MMTSRIKVLTALPLFLAGSLVLFSLVSCGDKENITPNPNNPKEQTLPAAPFTVKVCVTEPGIDKDSVYVFSATVSSASDCLDGRVSFTSVAAINPETGQPSRSFSATPDVVELALTPWNSITFETSGNVKVNAASSADVADIVALDASLTKYTLRPKMSGSTINLNWGDPDEGARSESVQAITDGYTDVRFWNGTSGAGNEHSITIRIRTANHIPVEGFEFALDGKKYLLVEQPVKTVGKDLPAECYLCKLPCIARPSEEYYHQGKKYETEEIYPPEKFSTIEFLGTVPRNATPDNKVAQHVDALSFKVAGFSGDYKIAHYWNGANFSEFRWMPFYERSKSDSYDYPSALMNNYKVPMYPADLRARKGKIFNLNSKELTGSSYHYTRNYYFRYTTGDNQRAWWGLIQNLFYGQNPN